MARAGGPDPTRPCDGCPKRAACASPCALLSAKLPPSELAAPQEISSPALMAGRGRDEAFMTRHAAEVEPEGADVSALLTAPLRSRLAELLEKLTPRQRTLIGTLLAGGTRADVTKGRGVARQSIHKTYWNAVRRMREALADDLLAELQQMLATAAGRERLERVAGMVVDRAG